LSKAITNKIEQHHILYKQNVCKDTYLEELFSQCFNEMGHTNYYSLSHDSKKDLIICANLIQIKSGRLSDDDVLEVSSSRTTKHKTMKEKTEWLKENKPDLYIMLSTDIRGSKRQKPKNAKRYYLIVIDPSKLSFDGNWEDKGSFLVKKDLNVEYKINKGLSEQLWFKINKSEFLHFEEIYVNC